MAKILNLGSLNIDHVYSVDHILRPGETLAAQKYELFPGGKGLNQSVALALSGAHVHHAGRIGRDGVWLLELLTQKGVDTSLVDTTGSVTGQALIQVSKDGQNCILLNGGANLELSEALVDQALSHFARGDYLVLQNEVNCLAAILEKAAARGLEIALNPSPIDDALPRLPLAHVRWFLLNEIEGKALTGRTQAEEICDALLERYPQARIVLTLGKDGVLYRDASQTLRHGIYEVPVVDTTAAGDTFTGYFIGRLSQGDGVEQALHLASVASSMAVSKKGAAISIPTLQDVRASTLRPAP